jgi:hypothetical protein
VRAEFVLLASVIGFGLLVLVVLISNVAFYVRLKRFEHDTWISLGSPMPLTNLDTFNFAQVRRFLREGGHKSLSDSRSAYLGSVVLVVDRVFLVYAAVAVCCVGYVVLSVAP